MSPIEGHGGDQIAESLAAHGIDRIFTLSGGHIFPVYDGMHRRGMRIIDVRHEQIGGFAAEAHAKLARAPGVCAFTAGPGVLNSVNPVVSANDGGTPLVMLGGRAPVIRWGQGSLQEMEHTPVFASITKHAETVLDTPAIGERFAAALALASSRRRGAVFLDIPIDIIYGRCEFEPAGPIERPSGDGLSGPVEDAVALLTAAERPAVLFGSDVWSDKAEEAARAFVGRLRVPAFLNGMGRGILPADHELVFNGARSHAFKTADVIVIVGTPLDFRLGFGDFGEAKVIHVVDDPARVGTHASPAAWVAGPLGAGLDALAQARAADRDGWIAELRKIEEERRAGYAEDLGREGAPIHPARVYGELVPLLPRDAIIVADGGDFVSYAGKFIDIYEPGCWLDAGAYGALGTSSGYALAAGLLHPDRKVVVMLGDGAAGFGMGDWDTLVRYGIDVTFVCGNNGTWGLELHPQKWVFGHTVAAELRPETRYDQVLAALGGHGELVKDPAELRPALERALAFEGPSLVNVITDPEVAYPRTANLT